MNVRAKIAACAIMKNEEHYVAEWLSYHYIVGIRRFFIYDNGPSEAMRKVIAQWHRADLVTVIDWPGPAAQLPAYQHCILTFREEAEWCAFIDTDEFLTPRLDLFNLGNILDRVSETATGLYVHWLLFGSSGHVEKPAGLVTEVFKRSGRASFPSHRFGKTIVRMQEATVARHSHVIRSAGNLVTETGENVDQRSDGGGVVVPSHRLLSLNHYFTKSRQEWDRKVAMGRVSKSPEAADYSRTEEDFKRHDLNDQEDSRAADIMQRAKEYFY